MQPMNCEKKQIVHCHSVLIPGYRKRKCVRSRFIEDILPHYLHVWMDVCNGCLKCCWNYLLGVFNEPFSCISREGCEKSISNISNAAVVLKEASSCCAAVPKARYIGWWPAGLHAWWAVLWISFSLIFPLRKIESWPKIQDRVHWIKDSAFSSRTFILGKKNEESLFKSKNEIVLSSKGWHPC